ncbi:unnamed protein product [Candidula unifasciata]|uniref:MIF4G domain-containing protein n=1 Tax=Candidula unifasciata TaxID=100452 RepID=A0A8S3Z6P4_9EUPU|nr:unnamed protein product [Candidula unifasciata]
MSSSDNPHNEAYSEPTYNHSFNEDVCLPRPPNTATQSRVLGQIRKNEQKQQEEASTTRGTPVTAAVSQPQSGHTTTPQQSLTLPQVYSQLNVQAKEFVPRSMGYTSDSGSTLGNSQDDESFSFSVTAAEFVPRTNDGFYSNADTAYYPGLPFQSGSNIVNNFSSLSVREPFDPYRQSDGYGSHSGNLILDRFSHSLNVLNLNPGNIEEYLRPVCEMIQSNSESTDVVTDVVEMLFEQSLQEPNFRYTGARICQYLNRNLKGNPYFSGFHKIFIKRCQKEYNLRDVLKNGSPADQERLRGLSMFMAEIFLNVETETNDGSLQRLSFLPKILVDLVSTLLATPSDLDVKCSCQLLKLSGSLIEDIVKHSQEDCIKFEEIFTQLFNLQSSPELTENVRFLIGSVLKLKEADWNRSSSSPPKKSLYTFTPESNNFKAPEPVFYNQRGAPCTRVEAGLPEDEDDDDEDAYVLNDEEEAAFLEWEAEKARQQAGWCTNDTGYESYQIDEASDDGGMGDEMEAAYEEFLQKQATMCPYPPNQANSVEHQMPPILLHMFNQPPPNMAPRQDFHGFPPQQQQQQQHHQHQQYMLPANSQQQPPHILMPNAQQNQQQQQPQGQQQYPPHYPRNDQYHFNR